MIRKWFYLSTLCVLLLNPCMAAFAVSAENGQRITVFTAIAPYAYFIEQISGGLVNAETLVGQGRDPHTFEPTPSQISRLHSAKAYFEVGLPFEEKLVQKMASLFPDLKIVDLNRGINLRKMEAAHGDASHGQESSAGDRTKSGDGHNHGHGSRVTDHKKTKSESDDHLHGVMDPHVWLSLKNVKIISANIAEALSSIMPSDAERFQTNLKSFIDRLNRLDEQMGTSLGSLKGKNFYVYHPAFGYLADDYGLTQRAVEIEGKEPTAKQLARLIDSARKDGIKVIFVAPQFSKKGAETVARGIDGIVVEIDPLERDYISNMTRISDRIESGVR